MLTKRNFIKQRGAGFFLSVCAFYFGLCLSSFSPSDPSGNRATSLAPANLGGHYGAWFADMAFQTLGFAIWLLPAIVLAWGVKALKGDSVSALWLRFCLLLLSLLFGSLFMAFIPAPLSWPITAGLGGSMGMLLKKIFVPMVGSAVSVFLAFSLTLFTAAGAFGMRKAEWQGLVQSGVKALMVGYALLRALIPKAREGELLQEVEEEEDAGEEIFEEKPRPWQRLAFWRKREEMAEEEGDAEEEEGEEPEEELPEPRRARVSPKEKPEKVKAAPKAQAQLALNPDEFELPPIQLLTPAPKHSRARVNESSLQQNAQLLENVLRDFNVHGTISEIRPGPVVTLYELEPAAGTKSSRVIGLADDIARSMSAISARVSVIPGRNAMGIELPNATRETVYFRSMIESDTFEGAEASLPLALGKDIGGVPVIADLARMPHLLVAGTTGSGKSVAINTMILSLIYRLTPEECKFIMIDPKMLELSIYDGIPHLLSPVVTEPGKAVVALKWTVKEMENRYRLLSSLNVRNIDGYNKKIREAKMKGTVLSRDVQTGFNPETGEAIIEEVPLEMVELPFIVVIVDEMADLMLVAGKDIESSIQRLAQMARAAGIHIIMATQRPSVDVITGVIKANFPTRISFQVTSRIDSRTILGEQGAEQLLGQGDMLFMAGGGRITRVHGPFVSDKEVEQVVAHLKTQGSPTYVEDVTRMEEGEGEGVGEDGLTDNDPLYRQAVDIVKRDKKASTSYVQRCLKIGYNRAATIIERMEREGIVGAANHVGKREVLD